MANWLKQKAEEFSEERIIKSIQRGNSKQFGQIYLKYIDRIFRYIFFRVNQDKMIAEDLTQMTFQKAFTNINNFQPDKGTLKSWIFRIAHNSVIDFYRQAAREGKLSDSHPSEDNVEEDFDKMEQTRQIKDAFIFLTDEQRAVVTMRFLEDMSYSEISTILDKREDAVRAIQYRALRTLKKKFNNDYGN